MGQLLKITTTNFEAVRISGGGKFVPSDQIEAERRRALQRGMLTARQAKIENQSFTREINNSYNRVSASAEMQMELGELENRQQHAELPTAPSEAVNAAPVKPEYSTAELQEGAPKALSSTPSPEQSQPPISQESNANYYQELGSLEMRIQRGDLSFVPPLNMTIVTQRPEVNIEYTGDFNYFPAPEEAGENVNIET